MAQLVEDLPHYAAVSLLTARVDETDATSSHVILVPAVARPRILRYLSYLVTANTALRVLRRRHGCLAGSVVLATSGDCIDPDVIYAHFCCAAFIELLRTGALELPSNTLLQRLRNLHYGSFLRTAAAVERLVYRRTGRGARVVVVSTGLKQEIIKYYGVDPDRITVVLNAVDSDAFVSDDQRGDARRVVRRELGLDKDAVIVLFVAAGDWKRKRLDLALEALAHLSEATHLVVVGSGDVAYYQGLASGLGVADRFHTVGVRSDVTRFYGAADVLVHPSAYETFGMVVLEAAAAGLPIIATRFTGVDETVTDGVNGYVVDTDAISLANALGRLIADPDQRRRMGDASVARAGTRTRDGLAEAIAQVCSERGRAHDDAIA
jgi:UDP-glucose:(heptosyl)LPS alpha-1,3-glucosyltransferase